MYGECMRARAVRLATWAGAVAMRAGLGVRVGVGVGPGWLRTRYLCRPMTCIVVPHALFSSGGVSARDPSTSPVASKDILAGAFSSLVLSTSSSKGKSSIPSAAYSSV